MELTPWLIWKSVRPEVSSDMRNGEKELKCRKGGVCPLGFILVRFTDRSFKIGREKAADVDTLSKIISTNSIAYPQGEQAYEYLNFGEAKHQPSVTLNATIRNP